VMRIFSDGHLVDETTLDSDIPLQRVEYQKDWLFGDDMIQDWISTPSKLFMYKINDDFLKNKITIQVENDDSNYTNGFLSKFSLLTFHDVFLIPSGLLHENNWRKLSRFRTKYKGKEGWPVPVHPRDIKVKETSNPWKHGFLWYPRGGSFTVEIPVCKKYNVTHLGKKIPTGKLDLFSKKARILRVFNALNNSK